MQQRLARGEAIVGDLAGLNVRRQPRDADVVRQLGIAEDAVDPCAQLLHQPQVGQPRPDIRPELPQNASLPSFSLRQTHREK